MKTKPLQPEMSLPISLETYQRLLTASGMGGFKKEFWEIGDIAVRDWLARNAPESFGKPVTAGYQWKHLFLPNGTVLRTVFEGSNYHCTVENDEIRFNGEIMSPSGFANAVGRTRRNAWKVIWLLFPNSSVWELAETLRRKRTVENKRSRDMYR